MSAIIRAAPYTETGISSECLYKVTNGGCEIRERIKHLILGGCKLLKISNEHNQNASSECLCRLSNLNERDSETVGTKLRRRHEYSIG